MKTLKRLINDSRLRRAKIAVVGDMMIDEYYSVDANRVSPEFPIPVLRCDTDQPNITVPAGAGNLANQFRNFNVDLRAIGFMDEYGRKIYKNVGVDTEYCIDLPTHIPVKRRFYQGQFPLCRWDLEGQNYGLDSAQIMGLQEDLLHLYSQISEPEVIIFADYNKGVFSQSHKMMACFPDAIKIVDPKVKPLDRWKGCTIFKPNKKEAQELSGIPADRWRSQCDYFQRAIGCTAVVLTHGGEGVYGKVMERYFDYRSPHQAVCESVIGAGDCFAAVLGLAMAHAVDIVEAIEIAYEAAAVYVGRKHNEPINLYDVLARYNPIESKFVDLDFLKNRNFKLTMTNGCFDVLHAGHIATFEFAKSKGDKLAVLVNSDQSIRKLKGDTRPIIPLEQRMKMIAALSCVDFVISFEEINPDYYINCIKPDVLVKGVEWDGKMKKPGGVGELFFAPMIANISTTKIIERIKNGEAKE